MAFFAVPYRVLFHDSMAYGSHHFLTNFKFQCEAREELLFGDLLAQAGNGESFADCVFLTQQGYTRAFAPVSVGERVGILLSIEESTLSSVRFCFRVIRRDGAPVCCGYQTVVCQSAETLQLRAAPAALRSVERRLRERLRFPSFAERVSAGDLTGVFSDEVIAAGKGIANAAPGEAYPRIVAAPGELADGRSLAGGPTLLFPGQGSYAWPLVRELRELDPDSGRAWSSLEEIAQTLLGGSLAALADAPSAEAHQQLVDAAPGLVQLAIYATGALIGRALIARGVPVRALAGHSAGEIGALAAAGALSLEAGAEIACRRALALAPVEGVGGMVALAADPDRVRRLCELLAPARLYLAVVNHPRQTVVSGADESLARLMEAAAHFKIAATRLKSRYPFHSPLMEVAVEPFRHSIASAVVGASAWPVYSPLEGRWYAAGEQLAAVLPGHLTRQLDFGAAAESLWQAGARQFIECGGGSALKQAMTALFASGGDGDGELEVFGTVGRPGTLREQVALLARRWGTGAAEPGAPPAREGRVTPAEPAGASGEAGDLTPVAIVSTGCVLPGAADPAQYWDNVLRGIGHLTDGATISPAHAADFLKPGGGPEKTYTLLAGIIRPDELAPLEGLDEGGWTLAQRLLARAMLQCRGGLQALSGRVQVWVGSTADGIAELDEGLLQLELDRLAREFPGEDRSPLRAALARVTGRRADDVARAAPTRQWQEAVQAVLGAGVTCLGVDAACASSLYSTALAVSALRDGRCDLAFAGGVFAPGPVNSCLFSQFRGLSATGSRPFDAGADGVVFSSGAAMVALKRLPDALRDGDRVIALVRGFGMSSDGKSVSVTEPKTVGQKLALGRAYRAAAVDPATVGFVEAHATSTPVGDAVELKSMGEVFAASSGQPALPVGSVKALIGHTGWAAGGASIVKVCAAFEHQTIPGQPNFSSLNAAVDLKDSRIHVPGAAQPWVRGAFPRRAGVNGFGFGGTNAHVVVEQFEEAVHGRWRRAAGTSPAAAEPVAVIGLGALFPWVEGGADGLRFDGSIRRLPDGKRLLPDVAEQMDRGQFLALTAATRALETLGERRNEWRESIGVVLGVEAKTEKSTVAIKRVYADYVRRRLGEELAAAGLAADGPGLRADLDRVDATLRGGGGSNAYTLPGLMPNLVAGRVCNLLDLRGPNFVVDAGADSFRQALVAAETLLRHADCSIVLAGGVGALTGPAADLMSMAGGREIAEGTAILALARLDWARAQGLPIWARLRLDGGDAAPSGDGLAADPRPYLMGAEGAWEVSRALDRCRRDRTAAVVSVGGSRLSFEPDAPAPAAPESARDGGAHAFGDVRLTVPRWRALPPRAAGAEPADAGRVLYLVDDARAAQLVAQADGALVLCPGGAAVAGCQAVDLTDDAAAKASLASVDPAAFSRVIAVKDLTGAAAGDASEAARPPLTEPLLDLLFVVTKHFYEPLAAGRVDLGALCTGAGSADALHPATGLFGGFAKAMARELPRARIQAVHTDAPLGSQAFECLARELAQTARPPVEIVYQGHQAGHLVLEESLRPAAAIAPALPEGAVVLMTGGGRGVTAVVAEVLVGRTGCRLVLVGRTDPGGVDPMVLKMNEAEFAAYETQFYQEQLKRDPGQRPAQLRRRYLQFQAAREVAANVEALRRLNPAVEYRQVDVTDAAAVDALVAAIAKQHGRLDLVVHGAGLQSSKRSDRKTLDEFRAIVAVKLRGIENIVDAAARQFPDRPPSVHLLTSAFSYLGNDGQPDYGAANEALGRLAQRAAGEGGRWTALGWLGWADVGMTRGSEYAELARSRRLRPLSRPEGKEIFATVLDSGVEGNQILVSDGELAFYGAECVPAAQVREPLEWRLSPAEQEFLANHKVGGVPTLPGTFEVELAIQSARRLRPDRLVTTVEDARFERFVKVFPDRELPLRASSRIVFEDQSQTLVRVEIHSDFVHRSGAVLKKDVLHFAAFVRLQDDIAPLNSALPQVEDMSVTVRDPYVDERAPVWLGAGFRCLHDIRLGGNHRRAAFRVEEPRMFSQLEDFVIPTVLLDGLCRFAMIRRDSDGSLPVYVPVSCRRLSLTHGNNDAQLIRERRRITLRAQTPQLDGGVIRNMRAEAAQADGALLLVVEDLVARPMGTVPDA